MKILVLSLCAVIGWALLSAEVASATTSAYPTPLVGKAPPGSLLYDPSVSGTISGGNPTDAYTLALDAGQSLTVLAAPAPSLQPTITVMDPSASVIGIATASAAGAYALIETVPVAAAGTYTISISAAGGTTGSYTAQATLNAALEGEIYLGSTNNTIGTAQDLSATALPLVTGADRMAVLGGIGGAADTDVYSFTLSAGQVATIVVTSLGAGASQVILEDGSGNALAVGVGGATNVTQVINRYQAPSAATYYAVVTGDAGVAYSLVVTRGADFDTEPNDTLATAQPVTAGAVLGALPNGDSSDFYSVSVNSGDNLSMRTATPAGGPGEFVNIFYPELLLYDNNGNLITAAAGNAADGRNSVIDFTIPSGGRWSVKIAPAPSTPPSSFGEYALRIQGATGAVVPDLTVSKSHTGGFIPGQTGTWTITVHNIGGGSSTSGTVTATDTLPSGYTLNTYSGTGWSCSGTSVVTCTSSLVVNGGNDFPLLSLVVNIPTSSATSVTNSVTVSGGGETDTTNDSATDTVSVVQITPTATPTETPTATATETPLGLGQSCSAGTQCASTFCVDGVCCNVACTEPIRSCNLPGSVGLCRLQSGVVPAASPAGVIALSVVLAAIGIATLRGTLGSKGS